LTTSLFDVPEHVARITHEHLRAYGEASNEGVVLWVGTLDPPTIVDAIVPRQDVSAGRFRVPLEERQRISRDLAGSGTFVVAQVHSHPGAAFHSSIDDEEAIPRRAGAYSLVVPDFGRRAHLLDGAALYRLEEGRWTPAPPDTFNIPRVAPQPQAITPARGLTRFTTWLTNTLKSFGRSRT
jgi:hypothetical protein